MAEPLDARWFASRLGNLSTRGVARETAALVRSGALPVGTKLPTVRELAYVLRVSPATISQAWAELRRLKIITGRGRNGSWVTGDSFSTRPERLMRGNTFEPDILNLTRAGPDVALLPDIRAALAHGAMAEELNSYVRKPILPELETTMRKTWPYDAGAMVATVGGYDAVYSVLNALLPPGASVAVEDPTGLRLLDILEDLEVPIIPFGCDRDGPLPGALEAALKHRPAMVLFQPRVHAVTGACVTPERMRALGDVLQASDALIVENDGVGDIAEAPRLSLGHRFPERVIHILSLSKSLGPDLRLAVMSASASHVEQVQAYRGFSTGWTSRILQAAGAWLLDDPASQQSLAQARAIYRERREALATCLARHGIAVDPGHGLCVFVPVPDSEASCSKLLSAGIAVVPGSTFSLAEPQAIRVATSCLTPENADRVARAIAETTRRAP